MPPGMKKSIIITVYNRPRHLQSCLHALTLQTTAGDEVVVADDGSDAAAQAQIKACLDACPLPTWYVRQEDAGYRLAAARNLAVRAATGDYLVFLDCDILLLPDALAVHAAQARPGRFLAGDRALLSAAQAAPLFAASFDGAALEQAWQAADHAEIRRHERKFRRHAFWRPWGLVKPHKPRILGCHFSLFRADFEAVNGFDENYVGWGLEDNDLSLRLLMAGCQPGSVIAAARALHLHHESLRPAGAGDWDSPNRAYFDRRPVAVRCENGLMRKSTDNPEQLQWKRGKSYHEFQNPFV